MTRKLSLSVLFAAALLLLQGMSQTAQGHSRALTLDDILKVEGLGAAMSDPAGRWFVYERLRPYDEMTDYSFRTYAFAKSGHQLWRLDRGGDREPELLPGLDPEKHSYLQDFSPSGRYLAVMQYHLGDLSLGAYEMKRERFRAFSQTPAFSRSGEHNPVWISDEDIIFAALPEGSRPAATSVRAHTGKTLSRAWSDAWRGDAVTASELSTSPKDLSHEQERGFLVRANARTGESTILAEGLYADIRLSPDRRFLAGLAVSKPRPVDADRLFDEDLRRFRIVLFDLKSEEMRPLAPGLEFFPYTLAWSPDGRRLAAFGWPAGDGPRNGRFYVIDPVTGATKKFDHKGLDLVSERERGWLQRPERVMFLGEDLVIFARPVGESAALEPRFTYQDIRPAGLARADWYRLSADGTSRNLTRDLQRVSAVPIHAGKSHVTIMAKDGVFRLYADGERIRLTPQLSGEIRYEHPGTFATRSGVIRPDFADEALFSVRGKGAADIIIVDLREGAEPASIRIETPVDNATALAGNLRAGAVLFSVKEGQATRLIEIAKADSSSVRNVASVNTHLEGVELGTWKTIAYEVDDPEGLLPPRMIESCVLLPPSHEGGPLPLIVNVYPNVGPRCKDGAPDISYADPYSPYLWAGKGYAYARLSTPQELIRTADGPIAGIDEVTGAGVKALVDGGIADPGRIALDGLSQGGVSALYIAAHSDLFSAVIAKHSWANMFSHYFGGSGISSYVYGEYIGAEAARYDSIAGSDFGIGRTPFEDPQTYIRNSPVFLAPMIDAPVLLIHSDMDSFPMGQFDEMFGALKRAGKNAHYVRYWGEGHGLSSPANIRDMWRRMDLFLLENGVAKKSGPDAAAPQ